MSIKCQENINIETINAEVEKTSKIWEDMITYLKQYNELNRDYLKKLTAFTQKNNSKLLLSHIDTKDEKEKILYSLAVKLDSLIQVQINSMNLLIDGLDRSNATALQSVQEQLNFQSKIRNDYYDGKNDLIEKYKKIEKAKKDFFDCAAITEDYLIKFQQFKKANGLPLNDVNEKEIETTDETIINERDEYIDVINNYLHKMKACEKVYIKSTKTAKNFEKSYLDRATSSISTSLTITKTVIEGMKNEIVTLMALLRGSAQMMFEESNADLQKYNQEQTGEMYGKEIEKSFITTMPFASIEPEAYQIKSLLKLKKSNDENAAETKFSANNNHIINNSQICTSDLSFEDVHEIVKMMYGNLKVRNGIEYDVDVEGNKIKLNQICNKLLIKQETTISEQEKEKIKEFLKEISYRQFFLQKLNDLRSHGVFKIEKKNYLIIGELLNFILDELSKINPNQDHYSAKSVIILSQTFYIQEEDNKKKKYLQELIQSNPLLKKKNFWDKFVNISIASEILDSQKTDSNYNWHKMEDLKKFSNIVFAQLVPIADNMVEFGVTVDTIKEIIQPVIDYYSISKENEEMIYGLLEGKKKLLEDEKKNEDKKE